MIFQKELPGNENTYNFFNFFSGMGIWLVLALILIGVFIYKKLKK